MISQEDLALYRETFPPGYHRASADWRSVTWETEKTAEQHPDLWGWIGKRCVCGNPADGWEEGRGYFCWDCFGNV